MLVGYEYVASVWRDGALLGMAVVGVEGPPDLWDEQGDPVWRDAMVLWSTDRLPTLDGEDMVVVSWEGGSEVPAIAEEVVGERGELVQETCWGQRVFSCFV